MEKLEKRIKYIDGLKGICTICIIVFHFLLLYKWDGFVGWNSFIPNNMTISQYYFANFPYSILTNNSFPLYVFFGLISFVQANSFFKNYDTNKVIDQAKKRYFRLMPIVIVSYLLSWACYKFDLYGFLEFIDCSGNSWVKGRLISNLSIKEVLLEGLVTAFFKTSQIVAPLWCLNYIFLGSYLTYGLLILFKYLKQRWIIYALGIVVFWFIDPSYLTFVLGVIASDVYSNIPLKNKKTACICLVCGLIVGHFPSVVLPQFLKIETLYGIGTFLVLISLEQTCQNSKILNNDKLVKLGKESFSVIVGNHFAMHPISIRVYTFMINGGFNVSITMIVTIIAYIFAHFILNKFFILVCNPISRFLIDKISSPKGNFKISK